MNTTTKELAVCMGCGKKLAATKLEEHQTDCKRFRLECKLIEAQDRIKV